MQIETVKIETLVHPEWNPRKASEKEAKDLKTSLEKFGFAEPIKVSNRVKTVEKL